MVTSAKDPLVGDSTEETTQLADYQSTHTQTPSTVEEPPKTRKKRSQVNKGWAAEGLIHWVALTEDHAVHHMPKEHETHHDEHHIRAFKHHSRGNMHAAHDHSHKGVTISELFFDLVFVTAVSAINDDLREEQLSFENYFQYFLVIWFFWKEITLYGSLLASDDLWHKIYFGAFGIGIVSLAMHCQGGWENDSNATRFAATGSYMSFILCFALTRAWVHLRHPQRPPADGHLIHRQRVAIALLKYRACATAISGLLWLGCAFFHTDSTRRWLFWIAFFVFPLSECIHAIYVDRHRQLHPDIRHFNERMEAFTLIVLGETMFGITKSPPLHNRETFYTVVVLGFCVLFLIKVYHFDVEEYHPEIHALGKSYSNKICWIYSTGMEGLGMALVGAGVAELNETAMSGETLQGSCRAHWMLAIGLFLNLFFGLGSRLSHSADIEEFDWAHELWYMQQVTQGILSFVVLFAPFFWPNDLPVFAPLIYISIAMLIVNVLGLLDEVFEIQEREKELQEQKDT